MTVTVLKNLRIIDPSRNLDETGTIIIGDDGRVLAAGREAMNQGAPEGATVRDCNGLVATPGLVDAQVPWGSPTVNPTTGAPDHVGMIEVVDLRTHHRHSRV